MKPIGIAALPVGIALAGLISLTIRSAGFSVTRGQDGEFTVSPWMFGATLDMDPDLRSLLSEFRPGEQGDWICSYHPWLPLSYDRVTVQRGGAVLDYSRGRSRYWLILAGVAAGPGLLWLLVQALICRNREVLPP